MEEQEEQDEEEVTVAGERKDEDVREMKNED